MSDVDEIAKKILDAARERGKGMVIVDREYEALEYDIVDALRAERAKVLAKFAAFADENGEPLRVANPLPKTADNCIVVPFVSVVYHPDHPGHALDVDVRTGEVIGQIGVGDGNRGTDWYEYPIETCYSTPEAAEAARKESHPCP